MISWSPVKNVWNTYTHSFYIVKNRTFCYELFLKLLTRQVRIMFSDNLLAREKVVSLNSMNFLPMKKVYVFQSSKVIISRKKKLISYQRRGIQQPFLIDKEAVNTYTLIYRISCCYGSDAY